MRLIDADTKITALLYDEEHEETNSVEMTIADFLDSHTEEGCPQNGGWISVKDGLPKEHPSMFAKLYGTEKWRSGLWRTESDRVLVTIKFPDNTRTVDKGRLQDGTWRTGVSPVLPQEVTHWAVWPEPAE